MNWEAFFIIGAFSIVLGVLLYIPGRWWAKRQLQKETKEPDDSADKFPLTPAGATFYGAVIAIILLGRTIAKIAPSSRFGEFVRTPAGMFIWLLTVLVIAWIIKVILERKGVALKKHEEN